MRILDDAFRMQNGYVLDFVNRTFSEFFDDEFGIDIYDDKYGFLGSSKANHLRAFIAADDPYMVSRVIRALWKYRENLPYQDQTSEYDNIKARIFELLARIEGGGAVPRTDALEQFKPDETLEELIAAIERDISANKPATALDRLHTYCMKKFAHILDERGIARDKDEPLHSRVGKYVKALKQEQNISEITLQIIKSSIGVFEKFNEVRNKKSLAHDNELVNQAEARFIFDGVSAFLRFVKSTETTRFGV
jgi:hypothetical protein